MLEPAEVADAVVTGIEEERRRVYVPRKLRWIVFAGRVAPNKLDARTARSGWQPSVGNDSGE